MGWLPSWLFLDLFGRLLLNLVKFAGTYPKDPKGRPHLKKHFLNFGPFQADWKTPNMSSVSLRSARFGAVFVFFCGWIKEVVLRSSNNQNPPLGTLLEKKCFG